MAKSAPKYLPWVVIGMVAAVLALGLAYVTYWQPQPITSNQATPAANQPLVEEPASETTQPGSYVVYSEKALDQTDASNRRILFFHASWCPQCRMIEEDINKQGVPSGMTIFKVNYDSSPELKGRYGVTLQTTFVELDTAGNLLKKHVAYNEPTLEATLLALGKE